MCRQPASVFESMRHITKRAFIIMSKPISTILIIAGLGAVFVSIALFTIVHTMNIHKRQRDTVGGYPALSWQQMAESDQAGGVLPTADVIHIFEIQSRVAKSETISDDDLNWLVNKLKANDLSGERKELARVRILEPIKAIKNFTPTQKNEIYEAVLPMLGNDAAFADPLDKTQASTIMRLIDDKRAIPYLTPLLTNSDEQVRLHAQHALDVIYHSKS